MSVTGVRVGGTQGSDGNICGIVLGEAGRSESDVGRGLVDVGDGHGQRLGKGQSSVAGPDADAVAALGLEIGDSGDL